MKTYNDFKQNSDKEFVELHGEVCPAIGDAIPYLAARDLALIQALRECVPKEAFTDYPDTEDGRRAKYENRLYNSAISQTHASIDEFMKEKHG